MLHPYFKLRPLAELPWSITELCRAYDWPTNLPGGGTIGIVELGGGWRQSDVNQFFRATKQPAPTIVDVSVDGTKNTPNESDADVEVALDIQIAAAAYYLATGKAATIRVYWARSIPDAVAAAAKDGCKVCSISWGADETEWGADACRQMDDAARAAMDSGTIVFAAAGDNDSSDGGDTPANVDCPASCPYVVACGGTTKTESSETVWQDNPGETDGNGTGGGYSTVFPVQKWQIGAPAPPTAALGRMIPDVSANADPNTGYQIWVGGRPEIVGGTSAVAPLLAGLFAALGDIHELVHHTMWKNQSAFVDITKGENGYYEAAVGPDPCSGLGAPIGTAIAALFPLAPPAPADATGESTSADTTAPEGSQGAAQGIFKKSVCLHGFSNRVTCPTCRADDGVALLHR